MGATHFSGPLYNGGVPIIGSGGGPTRFYGWWTGNAYFVDNTNGSNSNSGLEPGKAKLDLASAITAASAGDVIYIRPKAIVSAATDPTYITPATAANWTIPYAKYNLSVIGAGPQLGPGQIHMTYLRGHASVTTGTYGSATLTVNAPYTSIENLAFHRGGNTRALVEFHGDGLTTTALNAFGSSVNNCEFRYGNASMTAGLYVVDSWYCGAYNCHFQRNNPVAIRFYGSVSTAVGNYVVGNIFDGVVADMSCYVNIAGLPDYSYIRDNFFNSAVPTAGLAKYIYNEAHVNTGLIANNYFGADLSTVTTGIVQGTNVTVVGNFDTTAAIVA